jgi:hypothetical protein
MKICPHCAKENFRNEDNCERCHQSIQNISHEPFDFNDFFTKTLKSKYLVFFSLFGVSIFVNSSNTLIQDVHLILIAAAVIILLYLFWEAYLIDNPHKENKPPSGQVLIFYIVNIAVIVLIIVYESLPDVKGITTLPSLTLLIALFASILFFSSKTDFNKKRAMSWIFVGFMWALAIFLIAFFSIFILAKYNLDYLSEVYYWTVVLSLSFLFLCIGLMSGYFLGFGLLNIRDKNRGFLTYLDFLFKEYDSLESSILRFFLRSYLHRTCSGTNRETYITRLLNR